MVKHSEIKLQSMKRFSIEAPVIDKFKLNHHGQFFGCLGNNAEIFAKVSVRGNILAFPPPEVTMAPFLLVRTCEHDTYAHDDHTYHRENDTDIRAG